MENLNIYGMENLNIYGKVIESDLLDGFEVIVSSLLPKDTIYMAPSIPTIEIGSSFKKHTSNLWVPENYYPSNNPLDKVDYWLATGVLTQEKIQAALNPNATTNQPLPMWTWKSEVNSFVDKYTLYAMNQVQNQMPKSGVDSYEVYKPPKGVEQQLADLFPHLVDTDVLYPCHCNTKAKALKGIISSIIIHLNDAHHWTREEVANWLETLDVDLTMQAVSSGN